MPLLSHLSPYLSNHLPSHDLFLHHGSMYSWAYFSLVAGKFVFEGEQISRIYFTVIGGFFNKAQRQLSEKAVKRMDAACGL
jgi:hypothetical protein